MKTLIAALFAAGIGLTPLSSARAITVTAAPLAETAKEISSVVEVQTNRVGGCTRGYMLTPTGCQAIPSRYKRSAGKSTKPPAKEWGTVRKLQRKMIGRALMAAKHAPLSRWREVAAAFLRFPEGNLPARHVRHPGGYVEYPKG
jgi:hypothetical protein